MPTTLQDVVTRITRDYLNRTNLDNETVRAVQAAIRHYERNRYPWNETSTDLATVALQESVAVPTDFMVLDLLEITYAGSKYELHPRSFAEIRKYNAVPDAPALPSFYCERDDAFLLAPIPDASYTVTCSYMQKLPELTATSMTSSNDWLSACEDVIAYHATKLMWSNVLRNNDEAVKYAQLERDALTEVNTYIAQRLVRNIRPTRF
jgi:hypothetical protein